MNIFVTPNPFLRIYLTTIIPSNYHQAFVFINYKNEYYMINGFYIFYFT